MFTFWYPERFNTLKRAFQENFEKQSREANETANASLYISSDIAMHFLEAVDVLMNLNYWTHHADDVLYLLEQAKACYVDKDYTKINEMQRIIDHLFTHAHAKEQLNLHLAQYALCTVIGLSIFYKPTEISPLYLYSLYRGLSGLACNYLTRADITRQQIDLFVSAMSDAQKTEEYQLTLDRGMSCG